MAAVRVISLTQLTVNYMTWSHIKQKQTMIKMATHMVRLTNCKVYDLKTKRM